MNQILKNSVLLFLLIQINGIFAQEKTEIFSDVPKTLIIEGDADVKQEIEVLLSMIKRSKLLSNFSRNIK